MDVSEYGRNQVHYGYKEEGGDRVNMNTANHGVNEHERKNYVEMLTS